MGQGLAIEHYRHSGGGVFTTDGHAILTRDGFLQACVKPIKNVQLNLGYGLDNPKNEDVGREFYRQSEYLFGNIQVQITKDITAGIEMNYVETEWEQDKQTAHVTRLLLFIPGKTNNGGVFYSAPYLFLRIKSLGFPADLGGPTSPSSSINSIILAALL